MKKTINVLSLFNGMNCIGLALNKLDIKAQIYASEIDKHANKISDLLVPGTVNLGCITTVKAENLPIIDLLVGGSPCQGFSFAGKGLNFEDPRSKLFFEFVRILKECQAVNPSIKFLLENVRMKKEHEDFISKTLGIEPIMINSNRLSAQNRERLYWTNICSNQGFFFKECGIKQPQDKRIFLKDILEQDVDKKYFLSDKMIKGLSHSTGLKDSYLPAKFTENFEDSKSSCLTARMHKMGKSDTYIKISKDGKVKSNQDKASCLTAGGNSGGNHSDMDLFILQRGHGFNKGGEHTEKSPTLTSNAWQSNNFVVQLNESKESGGKQPYQQNRVYDTNYKSPCLDTDSGHKNILSEFGIRRLTPRECARLQTVPEWAIEIMLKSGVSDTQLYKMQGNGWTIDVIAYILSHETSLF